MDRQFEPQVLVIDNLRQAGVNLPIRPIHWTATSFSLLHVLLGRHIHVPLARGSLIDETSPPEIRDSA